jgi:hypothetical protein
MTRPEEMSEAHSDTEHDAIISALRAWGHLPLAWDAHRADGHLQDGWVNR